MVKTILKIAQSFLITIGISLTVAYFTSIFNSQLLVPTFLLVTVLQFVIFYFYNSKKDQKRRDTYLEFLTEQQALFEEQGAEVECATCKNIVFAPIKINNPESFSCPHCGTENSIYVNIETAVITKPVWMIFPKKNS